MHALCFTMEPMGECLKCLFRLTRGVPVRGVIGSTIGVHPRDTGLNPVKGNGHVFPSCRQLYLSSFSTAIFSSFYLRLSGTYMI